MAPRSAAPALKRTLARLMGDPSRVAPRRDAAREASVVIADDGFALLTPDGRCVLVGLDIDEESASVQVFSETGDEILLHELLDAAPLLSLLEGLRVMVREDEPEGIVAHSARRNSG
jgi:hypothetical protein